MKARPGCIPCCLARALRMCQVVAEDEWLHRKILCQIMAAMARRQYDVTPAEIAHEVLRMTAKTLGLADPYAERKALWYEETLGAEEELRARVEGSSDPLLAALKLAASANAFDSELDGDPQIPALVEGAAAAELAGEALEDLRADLAAAQRVLFVHDSAVETFFDKLLLEQIGAERITSVVRSAPVAADAVAADLERVALEPGGGVADPGIDCLGIPLSQCSSRFREIFGRSEVVIAKGQACYESLEGERNPSIYFLLRVKCAVMAEELGLSIGEFVLEHA